ncbi:MAG: OmpA family protein [Bacteroidales bacterium]|nr:OmpA family protein [Bacteroidales bacterium]
MKIHWTLLMFALSLMSVAKAQNRDVLSSNLVYNSSFEEYRECPRKIDALGTLTIVDAWYQPTAGSADYYNICGSRECGVPKNKLGIQEAHWGNGYCGIYCSKTDYREYLQTQLREPLRAGEMYRVAFYVSLSEYSSGSVATIGALFTTNRVSDTVRSVLMDKHHRQIAPGVSQTLSSYFEPQVVNDYDRVLTDTKGWTLVSGVFTAKGGERFLTIGNFYPASQSNVVDLDSLTYLLPGAYYYIDDVSVTCLGCRDKDTTVVSDSLIAPMVKESTEQDSIKAGATFILHDIFFDYDKALLLQQSYNELQGLLSILSRYPSMKIEIRGHTDGRGSIDYNQRLSENRAKAVVDYLVSKGVDPRRLQYKGFGKSQPIDTNATEEGRAHNRRVEFYIISM